jgi:phosphoribosylglycinamide formyltransferase-1
MAGKSVVILISGRGSNMEALLDARLPARIAAVISNNPQARGLGVAQARGVATAVVDHRAYPERAAFDNALAQEIGRHRPDLIALAGFMRILTAPFIERYRGQLMNIHPSLLPAFPGLDTHRRALAAGAKTHGCTVHFVTPAVDSGPIIVQAAVPVLSGDTEETLAERVLAEEHRIYPQAVRWFLEGKLWLENGQVRIDESCRNREAAAPPPGRP